MPVCGLETKEINGQLKRTAKLLTFSEIASTDPMSDPTYQFADHTFQHPDATCTSSSLCERKKIPGLHYADRH